MNSEQITFVKTRHVYDSYLDFWRLVELANFPTIYVDELNVSAPGVFIVAPMNGEWRPHIGNQADKPRNAHLVLWNLERPAGSAGSVGHYAAECRALQDGLIRDEDGEWITPGLGRFVDEVWVSDRRLAQEIGQRYVTLGSHEGLGSMSPDKQYDYCHMSYESGRRQSIYHHPHMAGVTCAPTCWPPERDSALRQSRFALNIHQDIHPFQEPLRLALFAAYGLPILSENCYDLFPYDGDMIVQNSYHGIIDKLKQMRDNDYRRWAEFGRHCRDVMCHEYEFGKMVKRAIEESVTQWR